MSELGRLSVAALLVWALGSVLFILLDLRRSARLGSANTLEDLRVAARSFGPQQREIIEYVAARIERDQALGLSCLDGLKIASKSHFGPQWPWTGLKEVLLLFVGLGPLVLGLLSGALRTYDAIERVQSLSPPLALLEGQSLLAGHLARVSEAYVDGGAGIAVLILIWTLQYWLSSPAVREARLVGALIRASVSLRPRQSTELLGLVLPLLTPDRGLERPVLASLAWVLAITIGWSALLSVTEIRGERSQPVSVSLWPAGRERPIEVSSSVDLPEAQGGRPVRLPRPVLAIGPDDVRLGPQVLTRLADGALASSWRDDAGRLIQDRPAGQRLLLAVDRDTAVRDALEILRFFADSMGTRDYLALFDRPGRERQVVLPMRFGPAPEALETTRLILGDEVIVDGALEKEPAETLRTRLQRRLRSHRGAPFFSVRAAGGMAWGDVVRLLGTADDLCPTNQDCALPGAGIQVWLLDTR